MEDHEKIVWIVVRDKFYTKEIRRFAQIWSLIIKLTPYFRISKNNCKFTSITRNYSNGGGRKSLLNIQMQSLTFGGGQNLYRLSRPSS